MNLHNLQHYLSEIKSHVSCPDKIYSKLYLSTLSQFITHCPAEDLKDRLRLAIIALKLRKGIFFPKNAVIEVIAAEEAQWTYALFSGSLLFGLEVDLITRIIPAIAESWLNDNPVLFKQWHNALEGLPNGDSDLEKVIRRAFDKFQSQSK